MVIKAVLFLLAALCLHAQTNGTISGYVKDPTGAVISGVKIVVTSTQTGASRSASTDDTGFYQVLGLVPGSYSIEAEAPGSSGFEHRTLPSRSTRTCEPT